MPRSYPTLFLPAHEFNPWPSRQWTKDASPSHIDIAPCASSDTPSRPPPHIVTPSPLWALIATDVTTCPRACRLFHHSGILWIGGVRWLEAARL